MAVLKCVDWADAREAKQAMELMGSWSKISVADALELLSPAFSSTEVQNKEKKETIFNNSSAKRKIHTAQNVQILGFLHFVRVLFLVQFVLLWLIVAVDLAIVVGLDAHGPGLSVPLCRKGIEVFTTACSGVSWFRNWERRSMGWPKINAMSMIASSWPSEVGTTNSNRDLKISSCCSCHF